ncbi:hypothetical protein AURDEDRAFT_187669 [Auricularia subglabra TFB-10046 SS5]|nr:hypothetical protein AURDEDRAFT_187669 [Auricularia subglabra TFB-10046 SS5]
MSATARAVLAYIRHWFAPAAPPPTTMEIISAHLKTALATDDGYKLPIAGMLFLFCLLAYHGRNRLAIVALYGLAVLFCLHLGPNVTIVAPRVLLAGAILRDAFNMFVPGDPTSSDEASLTTEPPTSGLIEPGAAAVSSANDANSE